MAGMTYLLVDAGDEGSSDLRHRIRHKSVIYICTYHSHVLNLLQSELALGVGASIKEITIVFIKLPDVTLHRGTPVCHVAATPPSCSPTLLHSLGVGL
jgi:hypothetical protein